jgi:hypothetical protein
VGRKEEEEKEEEEEEKQQPMSQPFRLQKCFKKTMHSGSNLNCIPKFHVPRRRLTLAVHVHVHVHAHILDFTFGSIPQMDCVNLNSSERLFACAEAELCTLSQCEPGFRTSLPILAAATRAPNFMSAAL